MLSSPPVLAMPTDDGAWVVDCSAFGIGAVAQQWQNGELKVIEYASRTLNRAERSYCATRRELLAMIFALKHFRSYLLGNHFVCRVDHMALKYYQATPEPLGQQARFLDFLAEFDFELQFRPGREHTNCDSLSRVRPCEVDGGYPCKQCNRRVTGSHVSSVTTRAQRRRLQSYSSQGEADRHDEGFSPAQAADPPGQACTRRTRKQKVRAGLLNRTAPQALASGVQNWCPQFLAEEQRKDPDIGPAIEWVTAGQRPPWEQIKPCGPALCALWRQFESLVFRDGVLRRLFHKTDGTVEFCQCILPASLRSSFLELIHGDAAGHLKFAKSSQHLM